MCTSTTRDVIIKDTTRGFLAQEKDVNLFITKVSKFPGHTISSISGNRSRGTIINSHIASNN